MAVSSMTPLDLARVLLTKAPQDLAALEVLSTSDVADEIVGFHAQQAVEKLVKAVLAAHGVEVPKTHDLRFLFEVASSNGIDVPEEVQETRWLTPWSVAFRYGDELSDRVDRAAAIMAVERVAAWATPLVPPQR
jgi:HEPN domain-containing protein